MIRRIININEEKCSGCGLCVTACHESAIELFEGKARLIREDYCDGLGDCLPQCPTGAITFVEREALAYDEAAVLENISRKRNREYNKRQGSAGRGCPGAMARAVRSKNEKDEATDFKPLSMLSQWPVQIKLLPIRADYFEDADLLVAADCTAYAYAGFHRDFMKGKITLIGCPKLDDIDYSEKLGLIFAQNNIKSVTALRMEVPCCGGIEYAVKRAIEAGGRNIECKVYTVTIDGEIMKAR